jgi:hypothetical protein
MRFRLLIVLVTLLMIASCSFAANETPLLAQGPTLSKSEIVFGYGGYLWSVARDGGNARQLTTGGHEGGAEFLQTGDGLRSPGNTTETWTHL